MVGGYPHERRAFQRAAQEQRKPVAILEGIFTFAAILGSSMSAIFGVSSIAYSAQAAMNELETPGQLPSVAAPDWLHGRVACDGA